MTTQDRQVRHLSERQGAPDGRYQEIFERARVGLAELDLEGRIQVVNPAINAMLGWSPEQLVGQPVLDFIAEPFREPTRQAMAELVRGEREQYVQEKRYLRADGGQLWMESHASLVRDDNGAPYSIIGVVVDIQARKESEAGGERLMQVLEATPDVVAMADPDWTLNYINPAGLQWLGLPESGTGLEAPLQVERRAGELAHPDWARRRIQQEAIPAALANGQWRGFSALLDSQGGEVPASQVVLAHWGANGEVQGLSTLIRERSQEAALEDELRLMATAFNSSQAILITDAHGRIERVNQAFTQITGYTEAEVQGRDPSLLKSGYHNEAFYEEMWRALREQGYWEGHILNRRRNGEVFPEWESITAVRDEQGVVQHYVAVFHELSTEQRLELEREASTDALTGLRNRSSMQRCLEREMARADRQRSALAALMLDVDHFKPVNDRFGHEVGDRVLQALGRTIGEQIRRTDCTGRWGGEEFLVLLAEADLEAGRGVADKLRRAVSDLAIDPVGGVTISIGLAAYRSGESASSLIQRLDCALYAAKETGRNRVVAETDLPGS
jgi:diguanylate cyclase (GGDEF)-like protein/PAS domain S-box-containing protein